MPRYNTVALTGQEPSVDNGKEYLEVDQAVISGNGGEEGLQNYYVADPSPLALGVNKAFTVTTANNEICNYWYDDLTATASYAGVLMWVDGTNGSFGVNPMIVTDGNSPMHIGENQTYYLLCNGVWTSATATYCKASVPSGFKGWMYIPFSAYIGGVPTGTISYCRIYINSTGDAEGNSVTASIPLYVRKEGVDVNGMPRYNTIALTGYAPISESDYDVNNDLTVNSEDLVELRKALLAGNGSDLNGDGVSDIRDLIRMKKFLAAQV